MSSSRVPTPSSPPWRDSRSPPPAGEPAPSSAPRDRRLSRLHLVMLVVSALAVVASATALVWNLVASPSVAAVFDVGDCADDVPFDGSVVQDVTRVDCGDLHELEVYALVAITAGGPFPGDEEVDARAAQSCRTAASAELVGLDPGWQLKALRPSVESWGQGDRTVTCFVTRASGNKTAGSITAG